MSPQAQQEQLNEIANLPRGWDSYDAAPINKRAILEARRIVSWMPDYWTIVPRSDGSLQLERHAGGLDIECVITGDGLAQETRASVEKPAAPPPCVFRTGCVNEQSCIDAGHCTHGAQMLAAMNGASGETPCGHVGTQAVLACVECGEVIETPAGITQAGRQAIETSGGICSCGTPYGKHCPIHTGKST